MATATRLYDARKDTACAAAAESPIVRVCIQHCLLPAIHRPPSPPDRSWLCRWWRHTSPGSVTCLLPVGSAALAVADAMSALGRRLHVVMEGWDKHAESSKHFEISISLSKVTVGVHMVWWLWGGAAACLSASFLELIYTRKSSDSENVTHVPCVSTCQSATSSGPHCVDSSPAAGPTSGVDFASFSARCEFLCCCCPPLQVLDVCGGVMLAWEMNGQELLPDHGYPVSASAAAVLGETTKGRTGSINSRHVVRKASKSDSTVEPLRSRCKEDSVSTVLSWQVLRLCLSHVSK